MTLNDLIERAANNAGSLKQLAAEMGKHQNRLTEWKKGTHKPDADEIAFLARKASLPVIETVAEIQMSLDSRYAEIWREALGKLKAAGIAASVAAIAMINPVPADAMPRPATSAGTQSVYYVNRRRKLAEWVMRLRLNLATA